MPEGRNRLVIWLAAPLLAVVALFSWAMASPVGASPDDDFHLASIWCGVGDRDGLCEPSEDPDEKKVPRDLANAPCYAHDRTVSASCQGDDFGELPLQLDSTDRGNFTGLYPPIFYFATGLLASDQLDVSVIAIRFLNVLLFVGAVVAVVALLPIGRRAPALLAVLATAVPLGIFLVASTNPSSWAMLSAAVVLPALIGYFETTGWRRVLLGLLGAAAAVMGSGARADSAVFVGLACAIAVLIAFARNRRFLLQALLPAALVLVALVFYLSASQSEASTTGLSEAPPPSGRAMFDLFLLNILDVPSLWVGVFGGWGLGWLDTPMPALVWIAGFTLFTSLLIQGYRKLDLRSAIAAAILFTAAVLFPTYLLIRTQAVVGAYVQPRYVLPILVMLTFVTLLRVQFRPSRRDIVLGIATLAAANSIALHTNIRRYTTGLEGLRLNLDAAVEWWWPVGPSPMTVWLVGTLSLTAALTALAAPSWRRASMYAASRQLKSE